MSGLKIDLLNVIRRIVKAGKAEAERNSYPNLDVFIHLLDELERLKLLIENDVEKL